MELTWGLRQSHKILYVSSVEGLMRDTFMGNAPPIFGYLSIR